VLGSVLFCYVYLDELLHALSAAKVGCYVGDIFVGVLACADDLVITAPSVTALRKMLALCDAYDSEYTMNFNATTSKCLVVLPSCRRYLAPLLSKCVFTRAAKAMRGNSHHRVCLCVCVSDAGIASKRLNERSRKQHNVTVRAHAGTLVL